MKLRHAFGKQLRILRESKNLSQEGFAELCKLHRTFIGRVERGECNVTLETAAKLAKGLGIPIKGLFSALNGKEAWSNGEIKKPLHLKDVLGNIKDPRRWINPDALVQLIIDNPSLRGMLYGYASEDAFVDFIHGLKITEHHKPDDHTKSKSDRTFTHNGREYTIQLKSLQTNSIKEVKTGSFTAKVQNDASDRRKVTLPNGKTLETTCYLRGEYDILGVSLQPFTGKWNFAFKKNKDLKESKGRKYSPEVRSFLLATLEDISYPLDDSWTTDLISLLDDPDIGKVQRDGP